MTQTPPVAPGQQLQPVPAEILAAFKFDDDASVTPPEPTPVTPVTPPVSPAPAPIEPVTPPTPATEPPSPEITPVAKEPSVPARFEGESDVQYDLRTKLFLAGQAKATAESAEEKSLISKEMKRIREDLAKANQGTTVPSQTQTTDDERANAIKTLNELGFKTAEQIEAEVNRNVEERLKAQDVARIRGEQDSAITDFYNHRDDIFTDDSKRGNFETYVLQMFGPQLPTMGKQQMLQVLDMAANYLYPRAQINSKIEAAADKKDVLDIHGNQGGSSKVSTVSDATKQQLRDLGWTEKAISSFGE